MEILWTTVERAVWFGGGIWEIEGGGWGGSHIMLKWEGGRKLFLKRQWLNKNVEMESANLIFYNSNMEMRNLGGVLYRVQ
jgi:hypothetical protein